MNILFLTKELPYPPDTGFRNRTFHLIKGLAARHKVTLVCFGDKNSDVNSIVPFCASIELVAPMNQNKSFWGLFFSLFIGRPYSVRSRFSPIMKEKMANLLESHRFDLLICDSIYQAVHVPTTNIPKILTEHNIESSIMRRYASVEKNPLIKLGAWIECLKMRSYEHSAWRRFEACLVCSDADKKDLQERTPGQKVEVIANGVDVDYFTPSRTETKKHSLVYVGQMNWQPNIDAVEYFLKEILPHIKATVPDASFTIVGNNPPEKIIKLAQERSSVTTGRVPDTRPFVGPAEVFVVPLRIGGGTRLKILEAMAMGKAIVSTSIGAEGIEVAHGENILIADTAQDFAGCVMELFKNRQLQEKLGTTARRLVTDKYSWEIITSKLNSIIENGIKRA